MATAAELIELRDYINEPDNTNGWTEEKLTDYLTRYSNTLRAASEAWAVKASQFAEVVDVSESGSSRSLGALFDRAQKMSEYYARRADEVEAEVPAVTGPVIQRIRRGFS